MTTGRKNLLLSLIILAELLCGIWLFWIRRPEIELPQPDLTGHHPYTVGQITEHIAQLNADSPTDIADTATRLLALGLFHEAEQYYRSAVRLSPEDPTFRRQWASVLSAMGELEESRRQFEIALSKDVTQSPAIHFHLAFIALREEDLPAARGHLQQCIGLPAAQLQLAQVLLFQGESTAADKILTDLQRKMPNAWRVYHLLSQAADADQDTVTAERFREISDLLSGQITSPLTDARERLVPHYESLSIRGLQRRALSVLQNAGPNAAEAMLQAFTPLPWDPATEDLASDIAAIRGDSSQQLEHLQSVIQRDGPTTYRLLRQSFALLGAGQQDDAIAALEQAAHLDNETSFSAVIDAMQQLADIENTAGNQERANTWRARALLQQSRQLLVAGAVPNALTAVTESTQLNASDARAWYLRGELEQLTGRDGAAIESYEKCLQIRPNHGRAQSRLQRLRQKAGQVHETGTAQNVLRS